MALPETELDVQRRIQIVADRPYSPLCRMNLASEYSRQKYYDLASGEAYMTLLLCDEIYDEEAEYHEYAFEAAVEDMKTHKVGDIRHIHTSSLENDQNELTSWVSLKIEHWAYILLSESLLLCANLRSAHDFCSRGLKRFAEDEDLLNLFSKVEDAARSILDDPEAKVDDYPDRGLVRREIYPWNTNEPERCSEETLITLNNMLQECAPKLQVRAADLPNLRSDDFQSPVKQLGLFAKEDLFPGDLVLNEKSLLTATSKWNDTFCDACSAALVSGSAETMSCSECAEVVFCSTECHDQAWEEYHRGVCGAEITSLAKDASPKEAADALYTLLLFRTFAMALTQNKHPLDLDAVKYICGDFEPHTSQQPKPTLPFSFHTNILLPLNYLELALANTTTTTTTATEVPTSPSDSDSDLNSGAQHTPTIFSLPWSAVWVINTLYAKFRGTASAHQSPVDGRPEVGAVHPLWSLANHSCDPNMRWEWGMPDGRIRFWVREQRVVWRGKKNGDEEDGSRHREQQKPKVVVVRGEEMLGHYCDVELSVQDRREWAEGALGGFCMCERCVWEAALEGQSSDDKSTVK